MERLKIQQKELKRKNQEQILYKNKLAFRTSFIQSLKNTLDWNHFCFVTIFCLYPALLLSGFVQIWTEAL
jgi:hypothetical protein